MKLKTFLCTAAFCAAAFLSAAPFCQVNRIPAGSKNIPWERAVEISGFSKVITLDHAAEQTALYLLHDGILEGDQLETGEVVESKRIYTDKESYNEMVFFNGQKIASIS